MADYLVQEDGTSKVILEDSSGDLLLETSTAGATPGFISSVTQVYAADTSPHQISAPTIASVTSVHAPTLAATGQQTFFTAAGTYLWLCPPGITQVYVECFGGGGSGTDGAGIGVAAGGGGGGGAYSARTAVPVTPGTTYTFVVGAHGSADTSGGGSTSNPGPGGDSSFTGDSGVQVIAKGGQPGTRVAPSGGVGGAGGSAASSTGDIKFSGGAGTGDQGGGDGGGAGAGGNYLATGASATTRLGGVGANGGGSGGDGGRQSSPPTISATPGAAPAGGGGGGHNGDFGAVGSDGKVIISTGVLMEFVATRSVVYAPSFPIAAPFIGSVTVVYAPSIPQVNVPFIGSRTHVFGAWTLFDPNKTYSGPGNGGETLLIRLAANGITETATLAANISDSATALELTGDGSFPSSDPFVATVDDEVVYLIQLAPGSYRIRRRGVSNTTRASHTAGATVSWGDSYDQAIVVTSPIAGSFTADISGSGSYTYPGWLHAFDSTQAYLSGDRYPMHVSQLLGVFAAGGGSGGSNKCDAAQPSSIASPTGASDDCPAALTVPSRIASDIDSGDVALVRYTNPEASVLDLGSRAVAIQSWFGLKRVDATDHDVTFTDPNGIVVDTTGGEGTYTGSVNATYPEPLPLGTGIAPDASDTAGTEIPTPNTVPWMTTTLPGSDRYFTYGSPGYNEKGWPFGVIAVRQGNRRIPHWQSWDWHNFSYVYTGFGPDDTFAQIVVNRNGIVFGSVPTVDLPGPQDIDGPDVVWDDATYFFATSWYVVIYAGPYLVAGPAIGGTVGPLTGDGFTPTVSFPGGSGGTSPGPPDVHVPTIEGGSGGDITGPVSQLFQAAAV